MSSATSYSSAQIAEVLGVSEEQVEEWLKKTDAPAVSGHDIRKWAKGIPDADRAVRKAESRDLSQRKEAKERLRKKGYTLAVYARVKGFNVSTFRAWMCGNFGLASIGGASQTFRQELQKDGFL